MTAQSKALKGYKEVFKTSGRKKYNWHKSIKSFKRTGYFKTKISGSGHDAGYKWGEAKQIDPRSQIRRYGKNSPSFDEGVYLYKKNAKERALEKSKS